MSRRRVLRLSVRAVMSAGLLGGYGFFAWIGSRFVVPARAGRLHRLFVGALNEVPVGATIPFETPDGRQVNVTRHGDAGTDSDFVALSSTCPHLGCQVHWEGSNNRYFCPCHNGTFDASGRGTGGPPGDAGLSLPRYALAVEKGLLFIVVPAEQLSVGRQAVVRPGTAPASVLRRPAADRQGPRA